VSGPDLIMIVERLLREAVMRIGKSSDYGKKKDSLRNKAIFERRSAC
jgi:hypothetical protein